MCNCKIPVLLVVFAVFSGFVQAQEIQRSKGHFSGSLETNWGFYMKDDKLGVKKVEDKVATNTYLTLGYSFKAFRNNSSFFIFVSYFSTMMLAVALVRADNLTDCIAA